jgi:large subunit ribosomal protein L19
MMNAILQKVYDANKRQIPVIRIGDTVRVQVRIKEGEKERLQAYEGVLIARNNSGMGETITVRKISFGTGVERIFPINGPVVESIEVVRTGQVRKSKLYYLRGLKGKAARLKERSNN